MIKSHENNSNDSDFKHAYIITVFLLIRLFYLHIHSLDYLFRFIQTLTMFMNLIDLIAVPLSIACCLPNLPLKLISSQCNKMFLFIYLNKYQLCIIKYKTLFLNFLNLLKIINLNFCKLLK